MIREATPLLCELRHPLRTSAQETQPVRSDPVLTPGRTIFRFGSNARRRLRESRAYAPLGWFPTQLTMQPGLGHGEFTIYRGGGDVEGRGRFVVGHSPEE